MKKTGPRRGPRTCTTYSALRYWLWIEPYTVRELAAQCDVTYTTAYKCIQKHAVR
jgi:hypothetical protein